MSIDIKLLVLSLHFLFKIILISSTAMNDIQGQMYQLNMMAKPPTTTSLNGDHNYHSRYYFFSGNSLSLQSRLETMSDNEAEAIVDATVTVSGIEIQPKNSTCEMCVFIWGSLIILPLFLLCCDCYKRCASAIYDIPESVYLSLGKLINGPNIRNLTLNVTDSNFGAQKAQILFQMIERSGLRGFTFINSAGSFDVNGKNYSSF